MKASSNSIAIFENENITVQTRDGQINKGQGIHIWVNAINPRDGIVYRRHAGWLSRSMVLHPSQRTQNYVIDAACALIEKHANEIHAALVAAGREMAQPHNRAWSFRFV